MSEVNEVQRLKEEVIPHLAMLAYSCGQLSQMPRDARVDVFQIEAEAALWWGRMEGKARDLDR